MEISGAPSISSAPNTTTSSIPSGSQSMQVLFLVPSAIPSGTPSLISAPVLLVNLQFQVVHQP
jgi:hypothetical protein